jgi:hypothetical protein
MSPQIWPLFVWGISFQVIRFRHSWLLNCARSKSTSLHHLDMEGTNGTWSVRLHPDDLQRANSLLLSTAFSSRKLIQRHLQNPSHKKAKNMPPPRWRWPRYPTTYLSLKSSMYQACSRPSPTCPVSHFPHAYFIPCSYHSWWRWQYHCPHCCYCQQFFSSCDITHISTYITLWKSHLALYKSALRALRPWP